MEFIKSINKIAIVIPYFGDRPKWMDYFFLTCSKNPEIDWLIFSDCITESGYTNIHQIPFSLKDFNRLASNKLGFDISIKHAYKLCDLKPAYGLIFSDYISEYEYWGYGDLDLVYGNIMKFFEPEDIGKYDILSNHTDFIPGHLCILKNTENINSLFTEITSYKSIFQSSKYVGFDEVLNPIKVSSNPMLYRLSKWLRVNFIRGEKISIGYMKKFSLFNYLNKYRIRNTEKTSYDFSTYVKINSQNGTISVKYQKTYNCDFTLLLENINEWSIQWESGKLFEHYSGKEIMYFHFMLSKNLKSFNIEDINSYKVENFIVTKKGIRKN